MKSIALKSIWAVVAGALVIVAITTAIDVVLHVVGIFPSWDVPIDDRQSLIALSYRVVIGAAGAYLTAAMAPSRPMKHALILGAIGTVLGGVAFVAVRGKGLGPDWYPAAVALFSLPECWAGGRLYEARQRMPDGGPLDERRR
jgi:hypothetical protein